MAGPATETTAEPVRKIDHLALAVAGKDKTLKPGELKDLQDIWKNKGEIELLEAEATEAMGDKQPNFPELESVLQNVVSATRKRDLLIKSKLMQDLVEGANIEVSDTYVQAVAQVAAGMPGMVAALAKEMGKTIPQARKLLADPNLSRTSAVGKAIEGRYLKDEKFVALLRKNIGENLEKPETMVGLDGDITTDTIKYEAEQTRIKGERDFYTNDAKTGVVDKVQELIRTTPSAYEFVKNNEQQFVRIQGMFKDVTLAEMALDRQNGLKSGEITSYQDQVLGELYAVPGVKKTFKINSAISLLYKENKNGTPVPGNAIKKEDIGKIEALQAAWQSAQRLKQFYNVDPKFDEHAGQVGGYREYFDGKKKESLDNDEATNNKLKNTLAVNTAKRDKMVNEVSQKVDRMMNKTVKDYYNQVVLKEVDRIVSYEAQQKAEDKKKAEDMAELREQKCKEIMDRFLHMSFLKYEGDKVVGWEDQDLKDFVKKDMLSKSPAKLAQDLLDRVYQNRSTIPPDYKKEIDAMMKEMGVTAGPPAVNAREVFKSIKTETYQKWAEEKVPDILGYAWARGYYFDRLKIKPAEREYLKLAYNNEDAGVDFFVNAMNAKKKYVDDAEKMLGESFMDGGVVNREKVKRFLVGKDWTEGLKKLWKVTQVAGAGYVLGGGLAFGTGPNGLAMGAHAVKDNLITLGTIAKGTARAVSSASNIALHGVLGNNAIANATPDGALKAGGLTEVLAKLNKGPLSVDNNLPVSP